MVDVPVNVHNKVEISNVSTKHYLVYLKSWEIGMSATLCNAYSVTIN